MTYIILLFLAVALLFYVLLGGADYGGGIIELFTGKKGTNTISKAIAPVWEANHVWLILVVVILFMGFPEVYSTVTLTLHIPLMLVLIGIIFRGSAFAFRYYDIESGPYKRIYTSFFRAFSVFTPFFLGVTLGAIILGRLTTDYTQSFYQVFVSPWSNLFSYSMGLFITLLFTFLASVYLIGETENEKERTVFVTLASRFYFGLILAGGLVFAAAEIDNLNLFSLFWHSPVSMVSLVLATLLIPFLWWDIRLHRTVMTRIIAGVQTLLILIGWFAIQYPVLVRTVNHDLTVSNTAAPAATQKQLIYALVIGVLIIIPSIVYLFRVFKLTSANKES